MISKETRIFIAIFILQVPVVAITLKSLAIILIVLITLIFFLITPVILTC